jgi:two-component system response regulator BaeR
MNTVQHHIMVVEDEIDIANLLRDYLESDGFRVSIHHNGDTAKRAIDTDRPDLLMIDIMLPGEDGLSLCQYIRRSSDMPIIMVTAKVDEVDRLLGLELGADDYICKPFLPREVVARVRSLLRRTHGFAAPTPATEQLTHQGLTLDLQTFRCTLNDQHVELTKVEFRLLQTLMQHPGRVYTRDALMDTCYADNRVVSDRTIDSHIRNLRRKLSDPVQAGGSSEQLIQSIYGMGYRLG